MEIINHFGLKCFKRKYEFRLVRDEYAIINNKSSFITGEIYSDEWCQKHRENCLKNYDLSMKFFSLLDKEKFDSEIKDFLEKNSDFKSVTDLNEYYGVSGCYIMVLDEYKQLYIGVTINVKQRIRNHWIQSQSFDRLLFPINAVESSIMSIDSFRALDTTRIFVKRGKLNTCINDEDKYINSFSKEFVCNRIGGGKYGDGLTTLIKALQTKKTRDLPNYLLNNE